MSLNPIIDMVNKAQADEIENLKTDVQNLKKGKSMKLIELQIFQDIGSNRLVKKVSINPEYIVYIKEDDTHAYVYLTNDSSLHTVESREEILKLISSNSKYIG